MPLARIADLNGPPEEVAFYVEAAKALSSHYNDFLDNYEEDNSHRKPGIHASEIAKCKRQAFYSLNVLEKKNSVSRLMRKRFQTGHAIHDMVQKHFRRMTIRENAMVHAGSFAVQYGWRMEFEDEVKVAPDKQPLAAKYLAQSSCDGVFTFFDANNQVVLRIALEIKTEAPDSFEKLKGPKPDHVDQIHFYMGFLDIPLVWFFYFNKGNQNNTESQPPWMLAFNPTIWKKLEERMQAVLEHHAKGEEPEREEGRHCDWCPYAYYCKPQPAATAPRQYTTVRRSGP